MLADVRSRPTFVVLIRDDERAALVANALTDAGPLTRDIRAVVPPVRGVGFFDDSNQQGALDRWWALSVPRDSTPIYLIEHDDRLLRWIRGVDGMFYVALDTVRAAYAYTGLDQVRTIVATNEQAFAYEVLNDLETLSARHDRSADGDVRGEYPRDRDIDAPRLQDQTSYAGITHPFELLQAMTATPWFRPEVGASADEASLDAPRASSERVRDGNVKIWQRLASVRRRATRREVDVVPHSELANIIRARGSMIVAVGSRKGGVGKTSHAAGIAIVAGEVLDTVGRRAAIVDANLANPDAWGHLSLPETAATVRQVVVALTDGDDPPRPVHASTAALACYPEARETSEYSRTDIERFAAYLREHYPFSVIDMTNRLPDATGGPEAAVAAYWLEHADALLLPTASSKQEFNGVLDYLDVQGLPPTVVAFLVPRSRRNREHPLTKRYLEAVTQRVCSVVPLPDESERVRYAVMEGIPAQDVSPRLKVAYRRLTAAIVRAPARVTA